jgi:hypothetical protein
LNELAADKVISSWEDAYDREVLEIREIKDEDLTDEFQANSEEVQKIIAQRKKRKEEAQKKEERNTKRRKVRAEKKKLKELADKYPEELK